MKSVLFGTNPSSSASTSTIPASQQNNQKLLQGTPGPNYTCFRCGNKGHYIQFCPKRDNNKIDLSSNPQLAEHVQQTRSLRLNHGIPSSFMAKTSDPTIIGTRRLNDGSLGINIKDSLAILQGKQEKNPFTAADSRQPRSIVNTNIPTELTCPICLALFNNPSVVPCCGHSFCDLCNSTLRFDWYKVYIF